MITCGASPQRHSLNAATRKEFAAIGSETRYVQVGESAGPTISLPAAALRSVPLTIMGTAGIPPRDILLDALQKVMAYGRQRGASASIRCASRSPTLRPPGNATNEVAGSLSSRSPKDDPSPPLKLETISESLATGLICITSPSFTMYSLPSKRSVPRALLRLRSANLGPGSNSSVQKIRLMPGNESKPASKLRICAMSCCSITDTCTASRAESRR